MFGSYQDTQNVNAKKNPSEGTNSTLFWETVGGTQQANPVDHLQTRNNQQYFQHEPAEYKSKPVPNIIVDD